MDRWSGYSIADLDNLVLTGAQENLIWQRARRASAVAAMPAGSQPSLYGVQPSVSLHSLPSD